MIFSERPQSMIVSEPAISSASHRGRIPSQIGSTRPPTTPTPSGMLSNASRTTLSQPGCAIASSSKKATYRPKAARHPKPDPFLPNVADHRSTLNRSDHLRRTIGGSIVDNDDLIVRPREFLIDNARNRLSEKIGPISRANDHGNEPFTRGHDVAPLPRKLERNPLAARNFRKRLMIVRGAFRG